MTESMRKKSFVALGALPQTPGIYRFPARMVILLDYNGGT